MRRLVLLGVLASAAWAPGRAGSAPVPVQAGGRVMLPRAGAPSARSRRVAATSLTLYYIHASAPVVLSVPAQPEAGGHWVRAAGGRWRRVRAERTGGMMSFRLHPDDWREGQTVLVVGKPPEMDLTDERPPAVIALRVDGQRWPDSPERDLGWRLAPLARVVWELADRSPMDPSAVQVAVNGRALENGEPGVSIRASGDGRRLTIALAPQQIRALSGQAEPRLEIVASDTAPAANSIRRALTMHLLLPPPVGKEVEARVDSSFPNYKPDPLTDGTVMEPGVSTADVTWASAETPVPHWVALVFARPRRVAGIEIFWAHYQGHYWSSSRYSLDYWDGRGWRRVAAQGAGKPARSTLHRFAPVTTRAVRIWQPASGGHPARPDLLWLTEVKVF